MSQVYSTEPQVSGRVIIETTHGPLEMQLWCRECPTTTRFFLQLCMDGFYDGMVFHRIIPGFLVQTGALRVSQSGKETPGYSGNENDIQMYRKNAQAMNALERRKYEMNSRIRFNHRGQVAMALGIEDDHDLSEMQPQFFITLDEAPNLDSKHVLFGTIQGPTFFNALRIGRTDVDEQTNQPQDIREAPRIQRVKIMENPIHTNIVPSQICPWNIKAPEKEASKKRKRKGVKNVSVLSFGGEFEEESGGGKRGGMKSSHDVIESKGLSKNVDVEVKKVLETPSNGETKRPPKQHATTKDIALGKSETDQPNDLQPIRHSIEEKVEEISQQPAKKQVPAEESIHKPEKGNTKPKMSLLEARREKYKKGSKDKQKRESDTMLKLLAFQSKRSKAGKPVSNKNDDLATRMFQRAEESSNRDGDGNHKTSSEAVSYHGQILDDDIDDQDRNDWMNTRFKCRKHMDNDARGGDGRDMDDYAVVDERKRDTKKSSFDRNRSHKHKKSK